MLRLIPLNQVKLLLDLPWEILNQALLLYPLIPTLRLPTVFATTVPSTLHSALALLVLLL